jgi:heme-degrading monooxygenase HmoA
MHCLFFDVQPKLGHMDHYFEHVARLKPVLAQHEGLVFLDRYRPLDDAEALLSHQLWADEAAIAAWRSDATHRASQSAGRKIHFDGYRIRVGEEVPLAAGGDETGRFLVAAYGSAPARLDGARSYESVNHPGRFVTLASHGSLSDAAGAATTCGAEEVRIFRILRDYTMTDRAEAPQP